MNTYRVNCLKKYIDESIMVSINENLNIRMSKELLNVYKKGYYDNELDFYSFIIEKINALGIKYPGNANPLFYIYLVPDDNFRKLLDFPSDRKTKAGGKPVICYDLDGFREAYGSSASLFYDKKDYSIMKIENTTHELAHLVFDMFFNSSRFIHEGFAEAFALYTLDMEKGFKEHIKVLSELDDKKIYTANQLLELEDNNKFNSKPLIKGGSVSFELPYISSYLFVVACIKKCEIKFNLDKVQATQKFMEVCSHSCCYSQWLIYDIANELGIKKDVLLDSNELQLEVLENIRNLNIK